MVWVRETEGTENGEEEREKRGVDEHVNEEMVECSMEREERLDLRERREEERVRGADDALERDMLLSVSVDAPSTSKREDDCPVNEEDV